METLTKLMGIEKNSIVSVVGSGGKTSLIKFLCLENKESKVLFTTTTKIEKPNFFFTTEATIAGNFVVFGKELKNKLENPGEHTILTLSKKFDYIFIEADGSKKKPYKWWSETEPVVVSFTTHTIGVIPISGFEKKVTPELVHRFPLFKKQFEGEFLTKEVLYKIILDKNGLFKSSKGRKILYISQTDSLKDFNNTVKLVEVLKENDINIDIFCGNTKNKIFEGKNYFAF